MPNDASGLPLSVVRALVLAACLTCSSGAASRADIDLPAGAPDVRLTEGLVVADIASWGRRTVNPDAIAEAMARGTLGSPRERDIVRRPEAMGGGERTWQSARASEQGEFARLPKSAYLLCTVQSATERVVLLDASGHTMAYVNGEPHAGDMYSHGYSRSPALPKKLAALAADASVDRAGARLSATGLASAGTATAFSAGLAAGATARTSGAATGTGTAFAASSGGSSRKVYSRTSLPDAQLNSTNMSMNGSFRGRSVLISI